MQNKFNLKHSNEPSPLDLAEFGLLPLFDDGTPDDDYDNSYYRYYFLNKEITDSSMDLATKIMKWNQDDYLDDIPVEKRKPIRIFINSDGGDLLTTWGIINAIKMSKTKVITIVQLKAFSAAAYILAAGHERYAMPGASALLHNGSLCMMGGVDQVRAADKHIKDYVTKVNDYFFAHTKVPKQTFSKKAKTDWYLSDQDMVNYGIIDGIIDDYEMLFDAEDKDKSKGDYKSNEQTDQADTSNHLHGACDVTGGHDSGDFLADGCVSKVCASSVPVHG